MRDKSAACRCAGLHASTVAFVAKPALRRSVLTVRVSTFSHTGQPQSTHASVLSGRNPAEIQLQVAARLAERWPANAPLAELSVELWLGRTSMFFLKHAAEAALSDMRCVAVDQTQREMFVAVFCRMEVSDLIVGPCGPGTSEREEPMSV